MPSGINWVKTSCYADDYEHRIRLNMQHNFVNHQILYQNHKSEIPYTNIGMETQQVADLYDCKILGLLTTLCLFKEPRVHRVRKT